MTGGTTRAGGVSQSPVGVNALEADAAARKAVREQLERSLIVEAGAGTGKTHSLVDRIEALIVSGKGAIEQIAAITFTRAAAAELRERVRSRLEARAHDGRSGRAAATERERVEKALEGLDRAAIQTIDSFALSLVRERNLEARVPPLIQPLDEIEASLAFDDRWRAWLDRELDGGRLDEPLARVVRLGFAAPLTRLQEIARAFHENYRLLSGVTFTADGPVARTAAQSVIRAEHDLVEVLHYADRETAPVLASRLDYAVGLARRLREAGPDSDASLYVLAEAQKLPTTDGRQELWPRMPDGTPAVKRAKGILTTLQREIDAELEQARTLALVPLLDAMAGFVYEYAEDRRRDGRPEFQDLLVWASDLVDVDAVRAQFQARCRYILIDEFQDTDPLQTELALKLAADSDGRLRPASLFIVGDPRQSIYRFRHADLSALRRVRVKVGDDPVYLTETRRTHTGLVDWVNDLFGGWMGRQEKPGQPAFVDLYSSRSPVRVSHGPPMGVYFFGEPIDGRVGDVRRLEARKIVDIALSIGAGEWQVLRRDRPDSVSTRKSCFGDLCILVPSRTSLAELERGFEDAGIPYVLEGQSLIFNTQDVRDLINCLNAIDDPSDEVAIVAALRSPAFGCSDVDLYRWTAAGRRFGYLSRLPAAGAAAEARQGPAAQSHQGNAAAERRVAGHDAVVDTSPDLALVADGLAALRGYHEQRMALPVPHLIEKFVRERRLRELAIDGVRPRERWRLLQAVIEQARALAKAGRPSLRDLVEWAIQRREQAEGIAEGATADLEPDAVRIMTVHYAKGLEFPIVLLTALNAGTNPRSRGPVVFEKGLAGEVTGVAVRANQDFVFGDHKRIADAEKVADAEEDVRVLYVAATRAQDHLLVSLYRTSNDKKSAAAAIAAKMLPGSPLWAELRAPAGSAQPSLFHMEGGPRVQLTEAARSEWEVARQRLLASASRRLTAAATALSSEADLDDVELSSPATDELPGRTRGGTAVGRAVHGVLQRAELDDELTRIVRDVATQEGIPQRANEVDKLARAVLQSDLVQRAARSPRCWREVYVSGTVDTPDGPAVIEGFIDLIFELPDGRLCIVDYKTDAPRPGQSLEEASRPHLLQIGAYVAAVERATQSSVGEAWILFARRAAQGAEAAYRVPGLPELSRSSALAAVRTLSARGAGGA